MKNKCNGMYSVYPDECDKCSRYMDDCDGSGIEPNPDEMISEHTLEGLDETAKKFKEGVVGKIADIDKHKERENE